MDAALMSQFNFGVRVETAKGMMDSGWMAYDKDGNHVASGVIGVGSMTHSDEPVAMIKCAPDVWEMLCDAIHEK